jgi:hypothetical protein
VNLVLSAILRLKKFDAYKVYSADRFLDKLKESEAKVDVIFVNGKIAADRAPMLLVKIKKNQSGDQDVYGCRRRN